VAAAPYHPPEVAAVGGLNCLVRLVEVAAMAGLNCPAEVAAMAGLNCPAQVAAMAGLNYPAEVAAMATLLHLEPSELCEWASVLVLAFW